jgi:hypothetical protein
MGKDKPIKRQGQTLWMLRASQHNEEWIPVVARNGKDLIYIAESYVLEYDAFVHWMDTKVDFKKKTVVVTYGEDADSGSSKTFYISEVEVL